MSGPPQERTPTSPRGTFAGLQGRARYLAMAAIALAMISAAAMCRRSTSEPVFVAAGPYELEVRLRPDPPRQHGNTLEILVTDATGERAAGVEVEADYSMPAMGAMPEMRGSAEVAPRGAGSYRARLDFPMVGTWTIAITVADEGPRHTAKLGLTVGRHGLRVESGGEPARPDLGATAAAPDHGHAREIAYYTCPMHPSVKAPAPGQCPICGMSLTPVVRSESEAAAVTIAPERQQAIGVRTAPATVEALEIDVRTVGRVTYDETRLADVSLKYEAWIGDLYANATGQRVERGEPLFTVYSPALLAAQHELAAAVRSREAAAKGSAPDRADYLVEAARGRLRLWDLTREQIATIEREQKAEEYVAIVSPVSGYVVEKNVVAGASVMPGQRLFRIAALDAVWIEADVYERDLGLIEVGQSVEVRLPYDSAKPIEGQVAFVYPYLDDATRTVRVRMEIANPALALKPDMYVDVRLTANLGERLVIPEEAVLYVGERRFVFVSLGEGRLEPRRVQVGRRSEDLVEITDGLTEGEQIVTSGNFLIAAESRLKVAMEQWQ